LDDRQGGTRVTAFVTGGFIPEELRGTFNSAIMHVADW
jgi:arylsulfatase I/J